MKAFILAAGLGSRLRPLTEDTTKPLLKVKGKFLIEWNLLKLKDAGFEEIIINTHHLGEKIENELGNGEKYNLKIKYSRESKILGTGGAILNAAHLIGSEDFLLLSGDLWTNYPFRRLIEFNVSGLAHMVLIRDDRREKGDVDLEKNSIILDGDLKEFTYSGIAKINPKIILNKEIKKIDLWKHLLMPLVSEGLISGEIFNGACLNINSRNDLDGLDSAISER